MNPKWVRRIGAVAAVAALAGAVALGAWVRARAEADARTQWRASLSGLADSRRLALDRWIEDALADAGAIAGFPTVLFVLGGTTPGRPFPEALGPDAHLAEILSRFTVGRSARRVGVLDREARLRGADRPGPPLVSAAAVAEVVASGRPAIRFEAGQAVFLVPVESTPETGAFVRVLGVVAVLEDLDDYVHVLLSTARETGPTCEVVLAQRRGGEIVFLSYLAKASDSPGSLRVRVESPAGRQLAMVAAFDGGEPFGEFADYRGDRVFAAGRRLRDPSLGLVAKIDVAVALGPARRQGYLAATALTSAMVALVLVGRGLWRRLERRHQEALVQSQARAALILDNMNDAVLFTDAEFRIVDANRAAERLYGRSRAELCSLTTVELRPAGARAGVEARLAEVRAGPVVFESEHSHRDGTRIPVEVAVRSIEVEGQRMHLALVRDVRERKLAEEGLRLAVDAASLGTWDWDLRTGRLSWGGHHARLFGLAAEEFDGRIETFLDRVHPEDRQRLSERLAECRREHREFQHEYRVVWPDGSVHWIFDHGRYDYNEAGEAVRMRGAIQETTAQRRVADDLRNLFRAIEQSPLSVVITNAAGAIEYVNPFFSEVTGYSREEALGQNPRLLKSGNQPAEFYAEMWATLLSGSEWRGRLTNKRKDGRLFTEDAVISPVTDDARRITHFIAVKRDVTEIQRRDEALSASRAQLAQAQKMESLGRLAGGMAHDFNNLLGVILGYAELSLRRIPAEDPLHRKLEEIAKAAERGGALTRQLLAYSRKQVLALTIVDLNSTLKDVSGMLTRLIGEDVELVVEPAPDLDRVRIDRGQIEQVLLNLAANSRDAMPEGGTLTLRTSNEEVGENDPRRRGLMPPGRYVRLAVSDTGTGMSEEVLGHMFEPFFTTKEHGRGTGLGLPTVYGIVKQSDGFVWVESGQGRGTTFEIFLPAVVAAPTPMARSASTARAGAHQWVLLVEDNATLRNVVREVLAQAGYRVLEAADGEAAVATAKDHPERIALLLSDVVLPKRSGPEIAADIQALQPGIRMLFTSGYTADTASVQKILDAGHAFLPKPATPEAILAKVTEVLGP